MKQQELNHEDYWEELKDNLMLIDSYDRNVEKMREFVAANGVLNPDPSKLVWLTGCGIHYTPSVLVEAVNKYYSTTEEYEKCVTLKPYSGEAVPDWFWEAVESILGLGANCEVAWPYIEIYGLAGTVSEI